MMSQQRYKYPRTPHLPWSPGSTNDDVRNLTTQPFEGKQVVVTEKLDGENTTFYPDHLHARSIDSGNHPSRDWVKRLHAQIAADIPQDWRLCGENLFAEHSIFYETLESYFYLFSIWNEENNCLSWEETVEWAQLFELSLPNVFYQGIWDEDSIKSLSFDESQCEGYVVRLVDDYHFSDFEQSVAKWVRASHVQSETHWMHSSVKPNRLKVKAE